MFLSHVSDLISIRGNSEILVPIRCFVIIQQVKAWINKLIGCAKKMSEKLVFNKICTPPPLLVLHASKTILPNTRVGFIYMASDGFMSEFCLRTDSRSRYTMFIDYF